MSVSKPVQAWIEQIDAQADLLLRTREETIPLDRGMGMNLDFVDKPAPVARTLYTAEATKKINTYIPDARVKAVEWQPGTEGTLKPKVVLTYGSSN